MIQTIFCTANLLLVLTNAQEVSRTATLTPSNIAMNGAYIQNNIQEVTKPNYNDAWWVNVLSQSTWHFILSLDQTWGFDPHHTSSISLTINSPAIRTTDLLFGFTTNNAHYISMAIPMDNVGRDVKIYPQCNTMTAGMGDISALPDFDRNCDIAGGSCTNWHSAPFNTRNLILTPPFTFTLENDPIRNTLQIYLDSVSYTPGLVSKCAFAAFPAQEGLKIYMAGNDMGESFMVSSFDVTATVDSTQTTTTTTKSPMTPILTMKPITPPVIHSNTLPAVPQATQPTQPTQPTKPAVRSTIATTTTTTTLDPQQQAYTTGPGQEFGAFGQLCAAAGPYTVCQSASAVAEQLTGGFMKCERDYDCCLCAAVQCGATTEGDGCRRFSAGAAGVFSVKAIDIIGVETGATIDCFGIESCALSEIHSVNVGTIRAANDYALKNAKVIVTDPVDGFGLDCIGTGSCEGLELLIEVSGPPVGYECNPKNLPELIEWEQIRCGGVDSCKNMKVTINNLGCHTVDVGTLECIQESSCVGASFALNGDTHFSNCLLKGTAHEVNGVERCFENLENLVCPDASSCSNAVRTLMNPMNGFILNCANVGSCAGAQLTINVNTDAPEPVQAFDGLKFSGRESGKGATIVINNWQPGVFLEVELVECTAADSCVDTTFVISEDVQISEITCNPGTCEGCIVTRNVNSPGIPCDAADITQI
eukprot:275340_1